MTGHRTVRATSVPRRSAACVAGERNDAVRWGPSPIRGGSASRTRTACSSSTTMFVVADGMGGHKAGEVASALTVQLLKRRLEPAESLDDVLAAVVEANNEIFQAATTNVDHQGMGTTLTGLFVVRAPASKAAPAADGATASPGTGLRVVRPHQRRRLAHLPAAPRPPAPDHGRPQLRPGARQHRPHHRRRGAHAPPPQHHHPGPRHRPVGARRRLDAADRARRPLRRRAPTGCPTRSTTTRSTRS